MKEIIIDETSVLLSGDSIMYLAKYCIKDTNVTGEYTLTRTYEEGELTTDEIAKKIQEEIYGKEYVCGIDRAKGNDITVVVKIDTEQMGKIDEVIKVFDDLKRNKRIWL